MNDKDDEIKKLREEIEKLKKEIEELKKEGPSEIGFSSIIRTVNEAVEKVIREIPMIIERELPKVYRRGRESITKRVVLYPFRVDVKEEKKVPHEEVERKVDEAISLIDTASQEEKGFRIDVDNLVKKIDATTVSDSIVVLANPDRIKILKLLYYGDRYFSELEEELGLGPSSLRHHLSKLMEGRLITQERMRGKYSITNRGIAALVLLAYLYERILGGGENVE